MGRKFRNPITVQGVESDDHRIIHQFEFRELPLALQWSPTGGGHDDAVPVGVLSNVWLEDTLWWGEGEYLEGDAVADAAILRAEAGAAFLSVIPSAKMEYRTMYVDPATGEMADPAEIEKAANAVWADMDEDGSLRAWLESLYERTEFDLYTVAAITQLDTACFHECRVALVNDEGPAAAPPIARVAASAEAQERASLVLRRLAASPALRPAAAYAQREYSRYTPYTISDSGVIAGHLCGWNSCHRAYRAQCERPQYQTSFDDFHTQWAPLDNGERLRVGVVTLAKGHLRTAAEYDEVASDPRCQLGTVRLHADKWGIQMCGTVHPDITAEQITRALASAPSGDWRNGRLFGIALVNTPGYIPTIVQEDEELHRMIASIPAPVTELTVEGVFFDAPPSVLTAACACETAPQSEPEGLGQGSDCGCGGHEGACTCDQKFTPRDLADLADLDHAFRRIKTRA